MKDRSVKHHYLPRHYLQGFTDDKDGFFVYDKQADKIHQSSPRASFFQNNLNTIISPGGTTSDWLEDLYTEIENRVWRSFDIIRGSTSRTPLDQSEKMDFFLFLSVLHWRLPSNIGFAEKLSETALDEENALLNFLALRTRSGEKVPKEVIEEIRNSSGFKKAMRIVLPFAPFLRDKNWARALDNWRFLYSADSKSWYIVGDNPIVTDGLNDHDPIKCLQKFIFPVSGRIILINTDPSIEHNFPPEIVIKFNMSILERSQRFVACQNKDFLEALIEMYKLFVQYDKRYLIIPDFFHALKV
jgi:hypothetical protein